MDAANNIPFDMNGNNSIDVEIVSWMASVTAPSFDDLGLASRFKLSIIGALTYSLHLIPSAFEVGDFRIQTSFASPASRT